MRAGQHLAKQARRLSAPEEVHTMAPAKKPPARGAGARKAAAAKKSSAEKPPSRRTVSLPKSGKDPKGGLTAEGRRIYNEATGGNLKPGVRGPADTPEKMLRKGSFLRRHFATPRGPVVDAHGEPTRQALEAAAWGEPVPKSEADERKLAEAGTELLEKYHASKGEVKTPGGRWKVDPAATKGAATKRTVGSRAMKSVKASSSKDAAKKTSKPS